MTATTITGITCTIILLTLNKDLAQGDRLEGEFQLITRVLPRQTLTLGANYRDNFQQQLHNLIESPYLSIWINLVTARTGPVCAG
jgi:hypothetical protein